MMIFSGAVSEFFSKHQGIKMIAIIFLLAIGGIILAEGLMDCYNKVFLKKNT